MTPLAPLLEWSPNRGGDRADGKPEELICMFQYGNKAITK